MRTTGSGEVALLAVLATLALTGCPDDAAGSGTDTDTDTGTMGATDPTTEGPTSDATTESTTSTGGGTMSGTNPTTTGDPTSTSQDTMPTDTDPSTTSETGETDTGNVTPSSFAITIDDVASPPALFKVDLNDGTGTRVCDLPPGRVYDSVTFGRDNTLFAHNLSADRIETINPCDCGFQVVGPTSIGTLEMTVDGDDGLLGMDPEFNALLSINANTGLATVIGPLGIVLDAGGIAWSDTDQEAWVIDATADQLLVVDLMTGQSTDMTTLSEDVSTPGVERDNVGDVLYVCSGDNLYSVEPADGDMTNLGAIGLSGPCDNLAVPFEAIACLE